MKRLGSYASFAVDTFLFRRRRPFLFILVINGQCNLDCFYCTSKNPDRYNLQQRRVFDALSEAYGRGNRTLMITGGEPLLWNSREADIDEVINFARKLGFFDIAVLTNGTFPLQIRNVTYIVTIDGTKETHNAIRHGTYDKILDNVKAATSPVIAAVTISKANAGVLEDAVREITSTNLFRGILFNFLTHRPDFIERNGVSGEEKIKILDRIWDLKRTGYPIILSRAALSAMRKNRWKRPIRQIELFAGDRWFRCCRDAQNIEVCRDCGYSGCVEVSQALKGCPSAILELMRAK